MVYSAHANDHEPWLILLSLAAGATINNHNPWLIGETTQSNRWACLLKMPEIIVVYGVISCCLNHSVHLRLTVSLACYYTRHVHVHTLFYRRGFRSWHVTPTHSDVKTAMAAVHLAMRTSAVCLPSAVRYVPMTVCVCHELIDYPSNVTS